MNLKAIHQKLKDEQDRLEPVMSIRHMAETLGYGSHGYVQEILKQLVNAGLAEEIPTGETGEKKRYRMIDKQFAYKHKESHD